MNINKLKGKIVENGMNVEQLAIAMGRNRCYLYRKFAKPKTLTLGDVLAIVEILHLTDEEAIEIFLAQKSHDTQ